MELHHRINGNLNRTGRLAGQRLDAFALGIRHPLSNSVHSRCRLNALRTHVRKVIKHSPDATLLLCQQCILTVKSASTSDFWNHYNNRSYK